MRVFLGGVVVGCLSSAGVYLANSLSPSPSLTKDTASPQPPALTPTPVHTTATSTNPFPPAPLPLTSTTASPLQPPSEHPAPLHHLPVTPNPHPSPPDNKTQVSMKTDTGSAATTTTTTARAEEILSHGWPSGGRVRRVYQNHVLEYDCGRRIPMWVAEHLTQDLLKGGADRSRSQFRSDLDLPLECQAHNSDYRRSGWSRGHMAPAADSKGSQGAMDDTFLLSNILPQDIDNNSGFWNRLEIFCRDLTQQYSDVWVTSGPVFLPSVTPGEEERGDGKKRVTYEVIGESEVAVPTHLYKVIVARTGEKVATGAFIVPNKPLGYEHHLKSFQVPLHHLERKVGMRFYTNLNRSATSDLCGETGCNLLTKGEMDLIIYTSRVRRAVNLHKLGRLWEEIQEKEVPVTPKLQEVYKKKLEELNAAAAAAAAAAVEREKEEMRGEMRSG